MQSAVTSRLLTLGFTSLLFGLVTTEFANSKDGDAFSCSVSDFHTWSDVPSSNDEEFIALNKAKTFDVLEFADHFVVTSTSTKFKPASTKYDIFQRSAYQVAAFDGTTFMLDTFVMRVADLQGPPSKARITLQTPTYLNTWYLDCALHN